MTKREKDELIAFVTIIVRDLNWFMLAAIIVALVALGFDRG